MSREVARQLAVWPSKVCLWRVLGVGSFALNLSGIVQTHAIAGCTDAAVSARQRSLRLGRLHRVIDPSAGAEVQTVAWQAFDAHLVAVRGLGCTGEAC